MHGRPGWESLYVTTWCVVYGRVETKNLHCVCINYVNMQSEKYALKLTIVEDSILLAPEGIEDLFILQISSACFSNQVSRDVLKDALQITCIFRIVNKLEVCNCLQQYKVCCFFMLVKFFWEMPVIGKQLVTKLMQGCVFNFWKLSLLLGTLGLFN